MPNAHITGIGRYVPPGVVTNHDLMARLDTTDEWIQQRTGIQKRRYSEGDVGAADMGAIAAREALARAGRRAEDMECVIFATLSPDVDMPASACVLQRLLGIGGMPAFDVRNQCTGFLYALASANALIKAGRCERILIVGGEVHSTGIDITTRGRDVAVIFGDGAAAVVVEAIAEPDKGILHSALHAEGRHADKLWLECAAWRERPRLTEAMFSADAPRVFPRMDGRYVFKHAVERCTQVIQEVLDAGGYRAEDIALVVPHQANLRINQLIALGFGWPEEKLANNIQQYGNTTAASIPLALYEAIEAGRVRAGDLVCLAGFGAGFTWGAILVRW
ncbi:MAG: 3-oxoacyl-ACP synthase III family protein [Candidatus Binatia bacterium]